MAVPLGLSSPPSYHSNDYLLLGDPSFDQLAPFLEDYSYFMTADLDGSAGHGGQQGLDFSMIDPDAAFNLSYQMESTDQPAHTGTRPFEAHSDGSQYSSKATAGQSTPEQPEARLATGFEDAFGSSMSSNTDEVVYTPESGHSIAQPGGGNDDTISPTSIGSDYVWIPLPGASSTAGLVANTQTPTAGHSSAQPQWFAGARGSGLRRPSPHLSANALSLNHLGGTAELGSWTGDNPNMDPDVGMPQDTTVYPDFNLVDNRTSNTVLSTPRHHGHQAQSLTHFGSFDQASRDTGLPHRAQQAADQDPWRHASPFARNHINVFYQPVSGDPSQFSAPINQQHQDSTLRYYEEPMADAPYPTAHMFMSSFRRTQHQSDLGSVVEPEPHVAAASGPRRSPVMIAVQHALVPPQQSLSPKNHGALPKAMQKQRILPVNRPSRQLQALAKAPTRATQALSKQDQNGKRRGGRQRGMHLTDEARKATKQARHEGICWRCSFQRDKCEGLPCTRCQGASLRCQLPFPCDRSKLPDFVHDLLPPSMTLMHQRQTIEDTVKDQVVKWVQARPIEVSITSGYGPPLTLTLYEFVPKTNDLLGQFQYVQDPQTGRLRRNHKYSPPLGLLKLDASDDAMFETYLEELLSPAHTWEFGWTAYEEESRVDPDAFQAKLLDQMCQLHVETEDEKLKPILHLTLRMLVTTYIMGHTLTICDNTLPAVLNQIQHSRTCEPQKHTSPRLANRQLKFYFAVMRMRFYEKILKCLQQLLKSSEKKEDHWMPSFCAMLGLAMVLEEVQRTLQIQADAKAAKEEMSDYEAFTEAKNACERIDERFHLLSALFKAKYRDKGWGASGSFGPGTPRFSDVTSHVFCQNVRQLTEERRSHLEDRKNVEFSADGSCLYTTRLVARFLLPLLEKP